MIYKSLILFSSLTLFAAIPSYAQDKEPPVDLQADSLTHDENGQSVTALGDVVLMQGERTLKADKVVYNIGEDTVIATGSVELIDANGDKHLSQNAKFNNALKDGFVEGLQTFLTDGSNFKADSARHEGGKRTVMKNASYTSCKTCKDSPDKEPLWQIIASEVAHDKESQSVSYKNARFEIKGVPVAYIPYFSHPDGSVDRKSGFLTPSAGYKSDLGAFVQGDYYWSIAPDKDLTFGVMAMTRESPMALVEYRQRWDDASLVMDGSVTYSSRRDIDGGADIVRDDKVRGSFSVDGLWDINNKWRSGIDIEVVSDDQYLRQYNFDNKYVLKNEIYAERFSGRNYAAGRLMAFQDLRTDENRQDQPHVLPEIEASFIGEPDSVPVIGGRWSADMSLLGLVRDNDEQGVNRAYSSIGWKKRHVSDFGLVSVLDANLQGAVYNVNDRTGSNGNDNIDGNSTEARGYGYINAATSYPVAKRLKKAQILIEPSVSLTVSPNIGVDSDIPNEDSQDVQIDALNLFEANRFSGVDGVEDRSHITYGARSGIYGDDGSYGEIFMGQSYRFNNNDNPFAKGSGLDRQSSDVVGQISANYKGDYALDYSFQLDDENLSPQRHEIDASARINRLDLSTRYLYAKALDGTDINETREQIRNSASYYINDNWRIYGSAQHDLGVDSGLREARFGVDYIGDCVSLSMVGQRNLTDKSSGNSGTEIMLRIGFKNLGEIKTSGVTLGRNEE